MPDYAAFGFRLASEIELDGLRRLSAPPDGLDCVRLGLGPVDDAPLDESCHWLSRDRAVLVWRGIGRIAVERGQCITVALDGDDVALLTQTLLGPAMGLLLQQRGAFPLHASAVRVGDEVVAFAGDTGMGKSTLAHALHMAGRHELVTDDIAALLPDGRSTGILPGYASVRLWPESLRQLDADPARHAPLHHETDKRLVELDVAHASLGPPLTLGRVYALRTAPSLRVEEHDGLEKAMVLLRHVYCPELTTATRTPSELLQSCVRIADTVRVFTLDRPDDLASLPELVARVERA